MMSEERTTPKETDGYGIAEEICNSVRYALGRLPPDTAVWRR